MFSVNKFITEFNELLDSDDYISKKRLDKFLDDNKFVINYIYDLKDEALKERVLNILNNNSTIIANRNEKYVNDKLIEHKEYFDNMFKGIDDSILLDEEQRRAIIIDEDYSLVIAGAGSGKTTTMAAKVKYLVEKKHIKEDKIILLAFTNKACEELSIRINEDFHLNVEVLTFHKLGMKFLRKIFYEPLTIVGSGTFVNLLEEYITKEVFEDKNKLKLFMESFKNYVFFDDKCLSYKTFNEYFDYYAKKTFENNKNNLADYCNKRLSNRLDNYISITGEKFKSRGEVTIANYLYINGISYIYENAYPNKVEEGRSYSPDFTIFNDGNPIYIEYYGLSKYHSDGKYDESEIDFYNKLIKKKKALHQKYGTDLIELYSEYDYDTNYIKELTKELDKRHITKIRKTYSEMFYKLLYTSKEVEYFNVINLFMVFISRFKEKGYHLKSFNELIEKEQNEKIKNQLCFIKEFYKYYENKIHSENKIDFADMINYAYRYASKLLKKEIEYDYIIIDEYQDISRQRYNFAKRISDLFNAKIVAVGDDWQAIYSFSGSDVELFTKFYELMGYASITKIQNTYRNSQELLNLTTNFVSKDTSSFNKELKSNKHLDKPVEIYYYDLENENSKYDSLISILKNLYNENKDGKILLLGRYKSEKEDLIQSNYFSAGPKDSIYLRENMDIKIDFLTIHKSKGLGYDNVILLTGYSGKHGFPSEVEDEAVLKRLDIKMDDMVSYPEERRLFYVALTRTKNKVYILCPYMPINKRSDFIREIETSEYVSRNLMII